MKYLLAVLCLSAALPCFGAIHLEMEVDYDGQTIAPSVTVASGNTATVTQGDIKIQVTATERGADSVAVAFKVFRVASSGETLLASPSVATLWGEPVRITQSGDGTSLSVLVTPTQLP